MTVEAGEARLREAPMTLEEVAGSLPALDVPIEDMPRLAREERAERLRDARR